MTRGFAAVALYNPKTPANVGGVLRAASVFGVALVVTTGRRYTRAPTDVTKAWRTIPLQHVADLRDAIPFDCVPVAVEITPNAKPLPSYRHPERAYYVLGPEDGSLPHDVLAWCRDVVVIPGRHCLNLAAAANVVLYDRAAKGPVA